MRGGKWVDLDGRAGGKELGAVEGKETIISLHSLHFVRGKKHLLSILFMYVHIYITGLDLHIRENIFFSDVGDLS